jgi:hypothetical protein
MQIQGCNVHISLFHSFLFPVSLLWSRCTWQIDPPMFGSWNGHLFIWLAYQWAPHPCIRHLCLPHILVITINWHKSVIHSTSFLANLGWIIGTTAAAILPTPACQQYLWTRYSWYWHLGYGYTTHWGIRCLDLSDHTLAHFLHELSLLLRCLRDPAGLLAWPWVMWPKKQSIKLYTYTTVASPAVVTLDLP